MVIAGLIWPDVPPPVTMNLYSIGDLLPARRSSTASGHTEYHTISGKKEYLRRTAVTYEWKRNTRRRYYLKLNGNIKHYLDHYDGRTLAAKRRKMSRKKATEVMLVGDQLITDVLAARGAHIRVLLTEKVVKEDQWTTHINRLLDRPIRKHLNKKGKLPDWRTKYGQI